MIYEDVFRWNKNEESMILDLNTLVVEKKKDLENLSKIKER